MRKREDGQDRGLYYRTVYKLIGSLKFELLRCVSLPDFVCHVSDAERFTVSSENRSVPCLRTHLVPSMSSDRLRSLAKDLS